MTNEQIENFLTQNKTGVAMVRINFRSRNSIIGLFTQTKDFVELKSKNLWRIVSSLHIEEYKKTKDENLTRIYNGTEFTKLSLEK